MLDKDIMKKIMVALIDEIDDVKKMPEIMEMVGKIINYMNTLTTDDEIKAYTLIALGTVANTAKTELSKSR